MQKLKDLWKGTGVTVPVTLAFDEASATEIINDYKKAMDKDDIDSFLSNEKWTFDQKNLMTSYVRDSKEGDPTTSGLVKYSQERRKQAEDTNNSLEVVGVKGKLASVGMSLLSAVGNGIVSMLASAAISGLLSWVDSQIRKSEIKIEKGQEAQKTINEINEGYSQKEKTVSDSGEIYAKLLAFLSPDSYNRQRGNVPLFFCSFLYQEEAEFRL